MLNAVLISMVVNMEVQEQESLDRTFEEEAKAKFEAYK